MDLSSLGKNKILFLVLFSLLVIPALAQNISTLRISVSLEDSTAFYNISVQFPQKISDFNYTILSEAEGVVVKDSLGNNINCNVQKGGLISTVVCSSLDVQSLSISYSSKDLVKPSDGRFLFSADHLMPMAIESLILEVKLPRGYVLTENPAVSACSPECLKASDGIRHVLIWNRRNLGQGFTFHVSAFFEGASIIGGLPPWTLVLTVIIILGGAVVFFVFYRKSLPAQLVLPILKDDEKRVWEAIMKHGSGVNQKTVVRESNYSKAKVSKVLKSLQERGLIRLERMGRTNKVHLAKESMKKEEKAPGNNQQPL